MPNGPYTGLASLFINESSEELQQQQSAYANSSEEPPVTEEVVVPDSSEEAPVTEEVIPPPSSEEAPVTEEIVVPDVSEEAPYTEDILDEEGWSIDTTYGSTEEINTNYTTEESPVTEEVSYDTSEEPPYTEEVSYDTSEEPPVTEEISTDFNIDDIVSEETQEFVENLILDSPVSEDGIPTIAPSDVSEEAPYTEEISTPDVSEEAPYTEEVSIPTGIPDVSEEAPYTEEVSVPDVSEEAPYTEEISTPGVSEEAPYTEEVSTPDVSEEAPYTEEVSAPDVDDTVTHTEDLVFPDNSEQFANQPVDEEPIEITFPEDSGFSGTDIVEPEYDDTQVTEEIDSEGWSVEESPVTEEVSTEIEYDDTQVTEEVSVPELPDEMTIDGEPLTEWEGTDVADDDIITEIVYDTPSGEFEPLTDEVTEPEYDDTAVTDEVTEPEYDDTQVTDEVTEPEYDDTQVTDEVTEPEYDDTQVTDEVTELEPEGDPEIPPDDSPPAGPKASPDPNVAADAEEIKDQVDKLSAGADNDIDAAINKTSDAISNSPIDQPHLGALKAQLEMKKDPINSAKTEPFRELKESVQQEKLEENLKDIIIWHTMDPQIETAGSNKKEGDFFTLMQYGFRKNLTDYYKDLTKAHPMDNEKIESSQFGMPFYIKDLRDGAFIFFRAYLEGISDSISPSWNSENYIGRSEPVYTYTSAEREIGFKLKIHASSADELDAIYMKLNKLTSLCYPQYKKHETVTVKHGENLEQTKQIQVGSIGAKERMKPPLTKLRLGELFGNSNDELTGFIKSLTHTFPDTGTWEMLQGKRVPKYIEVDFTYQVIHAETPSLSMAKMTREGNPENTFYGISKTIYNEEKERRNW